jgi:hypothetical protein
MTDTQRELTVLEHFEKWLEQYNDTSKVGFHMGNEYRSHMCRTVFEGAWNASAQVSQARIDELEVRNQTQLNLIIRQDNDNNNYVKQITALEARNRELESALKEIQSMASLTGAFSGIFEKATDALLPNQPTDALDKKEVK